MRGQQYLTGKYRQNSARELHWDRRQCPNRRPLLKPRGHFHSSKAVGLRITFRTTISGLNKAAMIQLYNKKGVLQDTVAGILRAIGVGHI